MNATLETQPVQPGSLHRMVGRSLPSLRFGAWIVDRVSDGIEGRSRLVTVDLKGEQWIWTRHLVEAFEMLDASNDKLTDAGTKTP